MKKCIICNDELTIANHAEYRRKNYINKCDQCITKEKREYARLIPKEKRRESSRKYSLDLKSNNPVKYTCKQLAGSSRKRATKKGLEYNIDTEFLLSIAPEKCPVFGFDLKYGGGTKGKTAASLDRIDSCKGYTRDNVQIISYLANLMKSNATENEMIEFAKWVLKEKGVHKDALK